MPYLPPLNLIRKKNEFLAPDFPADSSQFFRVHGFTSAVRQMPTAMHNPFAWTNVSSGKNACFAIWPHVDTKFFNSSHHFLSVDDWPGDAIFFLWGQPLKIIRKYSAKKRSSPLDFIFDPCASASSSHLFLVGEAEDMWLYPFARTNAFSAKNICFVIWARVDTKFLNSSHHVLSVDDWPGDATFFLWGQPLKIIRKYSVKKGPAPWILFLTRAPRPLEVTFFGWWSWTYVVVPLLQGQMYFQKKKTPVLQFGRVDTKFLNSSHHVLSVDDWPGDAIFFLWGQPLKIIPQVFSQKKVQPLGFYFWHLRLGLFKSLFWLVKLNMCVCTLLQGQLYFQQKKTYVLQFGRALTQNSWIRPIMSYLWMIGLVMRLFSCGANLWRSSASIQSKKGPAPWILFLTPAPWPLEVTFFGWWRWTYVFVPFCKVM